VTVAVVSSGDLGEDPAKLLCMLAVDRLAHRERL
jgi:hypothetical protein